MSIEYIYINVHVRACMCACLCVYFLAWSKDRNIFIWKGTVNMQLLEIKMQPSEWKNETTLAFFQIRSEVVVVAVIFAWMIEIFKESYLSLC